MPNPAVWGPVFHDCLMFIALSYPERPSAVFRSETEAFVVCFFNRLPCRTCRLHAKLYSNQHPPELASSRAFVEYLIEMHNDINAKQNKKSDWTQEEVLAAFYRRHYSDLGRVHTSETKRLEDHALLKAVAEGHTCVCQLQTNIQRTENERTTKHRSETVDQTEKPVRLDSPLESSSEARSDTLQWVLMGAVLVLVVLVVVLAYRIHRLKQSLS
mmetsp:Transcript_3634/g.5420  ORF Transcript_3634/g.5420 Transcript_3634/m.5420 type:complete len:214 (+) Transcript_3634:761-1402(+)